MNLGVAVGLLVDAIAKLELTAVLLLDQEVRQRKSAAEGGFLAADVVVVDAVADSAVSAADTSVADLVAASPPLPLVFFDLLQSPTLRHHLHRANSSHAALS